MVLADGLESEGYCIRPGEIGRVVQIMRDQQAWREKRERSVLVLIRSEAGACSVVRPTHIIPAPHSMLIEYTQQSRLPNLPKAQAASLSEGRVENNFKPRSLLRSSSATSQDCGDTEKLSKGSLPNIPVPHVPSYDATEDNIMGEDEGSKPNTNIPVFEINEETGEQVDKPWEEIYDSGSAVSQTTLRSRSAIDSAVRIAYWRDPVKVRKESAKYRKLGISPPKTQVLQRLEDEASFHVEAITARDILSGKLTTENYDVLCVPGGFATHYLEALSDFDKSEDEVSDDGRDDNDSDEENGSDEDNDSADHDSQGGGSYIKRFCRHGGGFVGICAGAYAGSNWGWGLADVDVVDIEHWCRGMSQRCFLTMTDEGRTVMNVPDDVDHVVVRYANGPLLSIGQSYRTTQTTSALALFASDFARKKSSPVGVMKDSPAIVAKKEDDKCKGRVILVSPHPEDGEPWTKAYFRNLFRWAAKVDTKCLENNTEGIPQHKIRGEWWRLLKRQDVKRYPPNLRDHGVSDGLRRLNAEARATRPSRPNCPSTKSNGTILRNRHRHISISKKQSSANSKSKAEYDRKVTQRPEPAYRDGYSMIVSSGSRLTRPYVECIAGPILITAPHGLKLAGPRRKHLREKHTTELALSLAKEMRKYLPKGYPCASFIVWNYKTARKYDSRNLDPNYLLKSEWVDCPFHTALLKFRAKFKERGIPCLHVDFHGKRDRKNSKTHRIDIGMQPFLVHPNAVKGWNSADVLEMRKVVKEEIDHAFKGVTIRGKRVSSNPDPRLHGWWGDSDSDTGEECETTMTHAAVLQNIPSFQLENPRSFRDKLMRQTKKRKDSEESLITRYAQAIAAVYEKVCVIERRKGLNGIQLGGCTSSSIVSSGGETKTSSSSEVSSVIGNENSLTWEQIDAEVDLYKHSEASSEDTEEEICRCFFVYGSLRPDDFTGMPWKDSWLVGTCTTPVRGEVRGRMFDDEYASVIIDDKPRAKMRQENTVQGFLVEFPKSLIEKKLIDADEIEGCPDMYQRVKTIVRVCNSCRTFWRESWIYVRPNCSQRMEVKSGDWVKYQRTKMKDFKKGPGVIQSNDMCSSTTRRKERDQEVRSFAEAGFPVYSGQTEGGNKKFDTVEIMIDQMISDCIALDCPDPDRQI